MTDEAKKNPMDGFLKYLGSFLEIFKSRTRTVAIVGAVAYFVNKFTDFQIDAERAAEALNQAAQSAPPLTIEDLIVLAVTAGVTYFHANQKVVVVENPPTPPQP